MCYKRQYILYMEKERYREENTIYYLVAYFLYILGFDHMINT